ncbi:energy transducer TonB [Bryobacter aggregatus]|uniref:energy transducer TonB n=1 Tax=Bryobacter aggregatus TaxID=360054 RepID=UPI0004E1F036|nr:energy transducer TonB [Bryobacter aggregatus]
MYIRLRNAAMLLTMNLVLTATLLAESLDVRTIVTAGELPLYPPTAIAARLEGTVVLAVRVVNGVVQQAEPTAHANALLASAARRNVLSWRFGPEVSGTVNVRFVYELEKQEVMQPENPEILLRLPESVRIVAKPVRALTVGK